MMTLVIVDVKRPVIMTMMMIMMALVIVIMTMTRIIAIL